VIFLQHAMWFIKLFCTTHRVDIRQRRLRKFPTHWFAWRFRATSLKHGPANLIYQEAILKDAMNAEFESSPTGGYLLKKIFAKRQRIFEAFMAFRQGDADGSILSLVSVQEITPEAAGDAATRDKVALLLRHSGQERICRPADCASLPFTDGEFDWVFCDAAIEHAGHFERQYLLLRELMRVSRRGVFLATSNRWYPIELHTFLPLLHWLPEIWWRRILRRLGKGAWASGTMLNLLDARELQKLASLLPGQPTCSIGHIRLLGWKAYFFLQIEKPDYLIT
jgi:hypothetical protein